MHRSILIGIVCASVSHACLQPLHAQNSISADTLNSSFARSLFKTASASQSRLNNGREYDPNNPRIKGHPFFETTAWTEGSLVYDGAEFKNVKMLYDLEKDEVIVLNFLLPNKLSLVKQKIEGFKIQGKQFIYLKTDSLNRESSGGFYQLLHDNKIAVLAKRKKEVKVINNTTRDASFNQVDEYFLMKNQIMHPVKTLGSVLKLLEVKKADIQQHLRKNAIIFRDDPERAMVSIAVYYDQLSY